MKNDEVDEILLRTLDDERLSRGEKQVLTDLFAEHGDDAGRLAFFRHRAFAIARDRTRDPRDGRVVRWLEEVVKALTAAASPDVQPQLAEAHFSPGDHCLRRIVSLISVARRTADICVFTITDDRIARALLEAHNRGVRVRIITDDEKTSDLGSDVDQLAAAGIPVRMDDSTHHMHHKFAIFDNTYLVTGSYNWTRSAAAHNEENIVVSSDPRLRRAFVEKFDKLWKAFA